MNKNYLLLFVALPMMCVCNGNRNASVETSDKDVGVDTSLVEVEEAEPVTLKIDPDYVNSKQNS